MVLATDRQKHKMVELEIAFDESTTLEEAAQMIRLEKELTDKYIVRRAAFLNENCIVVASEWED